MILFLYQPQLNELTYKDSQKAAAGGGGGEGKVAYFGRNVHTQRDNDRRR